MMNKIIYFFMATIFMFFIYSFSHNGTSRYFRGDNKSAVIENLNVDNYFVKGKNKQYFSQIPERVIVVGENETETLLALNVEKNILAAVAQNKRAYAMREENAEKFNRIKKVANGNLNMEYITQMHPDLIVAQECIFVRHRLNNTDYWNERNVKTMIPLNTNSPSKHVSVETIEKEMQFIADLGKIFHKEQRANEIIDSTYQTIDEINEKNKDYHKPKVMIIEFLSSIICYDKNKLVGNMVSRIGGQVGENPAVIGWENIVKENPDVLFVVCSHGDYGTCINKVLDNPALKNLKCIKNKHTYSIPLRFTYGTGCRTEDGLKYLAQHMYPEIKL